MKLPITPCLATALLASTGCDDGATAPTDDVELRAGEGGSSTTFAVRETEHPTKKKGCDPIWWLVGEEELVSYEDAYEEWQGRIKVEALNHADAVLEAYGAGGMCTSACKEAGADWTGEVSVEESWHEVGATEVVGECPFGTLATETEILAMGAVSCACAG